MQGFGSKLTAYDFLGMLIPGIVVVYCFCLSFFHCTLYESFTRYCCWKTDVIDSPTVLNRTCAAILFFSISYIVGIFINCLADCVFGRFRNNDKLLQFAELRFRQRQSKTKRRFKTPNKIACQVIGLANETETSRQKAYYKRYYWLLNCNKLSGAVPVLEAQVVFVRNMIMPTVLLFAIPFLHCFFIKICVIVALLFCEFLVMIMRQQRIYNIILEDYKMYKELTNHEKNIFNHNS